MICTSSGKTVPCPLIYHLELVRLRVVCLQSNNSVHFLAAARNGKTTRDRQVSGSNSVGSAQRQAALSLMHYVDWHSPRRTPPLKTNTAQYAFITSHTITPLHIGPTRQHLRSCFTDLISTRPPGRSSRSISERDVIIVIALLELVEVWIVGRRRGVSQPRIAFVEANVECH